MQPRISLITLGVNDLTQSTRFYQQLGLPHFDFEIDTVAFFELQGSWLALYPKQTSLRMLGLSLVKRSRVR
jgi:catechol 2,3-dioxygenase-like lactoylglutathione lyase family enzyme